MLDKFWNSFIRNWEVLLNGNPAVDVFNGIKLAAGGELGIGVGEEEWGSGEREVLEGFVGRTDGLVDLIVSRFGEAAEDAKSATVFPKTTSPPKVKSDSDQWLGAGRCPDCSDGVIFSGLGSVSRTTLKSVSAWMEWLYQYGQQTYGVESHPNSVRCKKRRRANNSAAGRSTLTAKSPLIPPSMFQVNNVTASPTPAPQTQESTVATNTESTKSDALPNDRQTKSKTAENETETETGTETVVKYLTLGVYGSSWGIPFNRPQVARQQTSDATAVVNAENESLQKSLQPQGERATPSETDTANPSRFDDGFFLIGLKGNLEADELIEDEDGPPTDAGSETESLNQRIVLRSLYVERNRDHKDDSDPDLLTPGGLLTAEPYVS